MDLIIIPLLEGPLFTKLDEDCTMINTVKYMGLNLPMLPLQTLHALHQGISEELRIKKQCALIVINEFKVNNEKMFVEKT